MMIEHVEEEYNDYDVGTFIDHVRKEIKFRKTPNYVYICLSRLMIC